MKDEQIIDLYWRRDETAIEETDKHYGAYCFSIANNILNSSRDSEECVNDTWVKAWNSMPPHRPDRLRLFLARITRSISFNRYKANRALKRGGSELELALEELEQVADGCGSVEQVVEMAQLEQTIALFLASLPERERSIFLRRYFYVESVAQIAKNYALTPQHTSVILSRTRKKLGDFLRLRGYVI